MKKSLYIHIPFCKRKCYYCDFNSYSGLDDKIAPYFKALKKELKIITENTKLFKGVYIGGGTPSFVPAQYINELLSMISCEGEITIEVNPGTVTREKLEIYKSSGINRLSIGLQVTQEELLRRIGRIHTLNDFENTYKMARKFGFNNINVDLMFGLPNQRKKDVEDSVEYLISLNPEHISCYSLILHDENKNKYPNIFSNLPTDEEEREMYHFICNRLKEAGYTQYEISNFAKPGFESKHNLCYWNQEEYYGIGAGASSYIDKRRYTNLSNIDEYISKLFSLEDETISEMIKSISNIEEEQSPESKLREYIILQLRLLKGVSQKEVFDKFEVDLLSLFKEEISRLIEMGLLEQLEVNRDTYLKLTTKGLDFANVVWEEFI